MPLSCPLRVRVTPPTARQSAGARAVCCGKACWRGAEWPEAGPGPEATQRHSQEALGHREDPALCDPQAREIFLFYTDWEMQTDSFLSKKEKRK